MSFKFSWPRFSEQFHTDAKELLDAALNKGSKPPIIADRIQVVELEMGSQPPELEVRDIGELTTDQFRGIFRLTYGGDAHVVLQTKVQANPLNHKRHDIHILAGSVGILAAHQPLVVPMLLRLSNFRLSAYVVLVVSKQKGITLVFKTDPLQNVDVNSTFDSIAVIQKYIQREIEGQLRNVFREDLPGIIHRLSQRWLAAQTEQKVKVEMASHQSPYHPIPLTKNNLASLPNDISYISPSIASNTTPYSLPLARRVSNSRLSYTKTIKSPPANHPPENLTDDVTQGFEGSDPTYGLRSEGLTSRSGFSQYATLHVPVQGLRDLAVDRIGPSEASERSVSEEDEDHSLSGTTSATPSPYHEEFETIPGVGGGTVTRLRTHHTSSRLGQSDKLAYTIDNYTPLRNTLEQRPQAQHPMTARSVSSSSISTSQFPQSGGASNHPPLSELMRAPVKAMETKDDGSAHLPRDWQSTLIPRQSTREDATTDNDGGLSPLTEPSIYSGDSKIILRPSLNNTVSHLSALSYSYHTLSPYTRSMEHFTVRSGPRRDAVTVMSAHSKLKANRKRIYRLGTTSLSTVVHADSQSLGSMATPDPPPECELSDIEHYFQDPGNPQESLP